MLNIIVLFLSLFQPNPEKGKSMNPKFKAELEKIYKLDIPTISIKEFLNLNGDSLYVLDAREDEEYNISHLRYAKNVGYIWFDIRSVYNIPKNKTIVIYCSVGNRAQKIAEMLIRAGYKNVYNLYGGIFEWVNEGYPVYASNGAQTSQIHAYNKRWSIWLEWGTKVF